jgi:integrase
VAKGEYIGFVDADDFIEWRKNFSLPANRKTVKAKVSNSTLNHTVGVLSCFFNWCIKKNYYNQMNPFLMQRRRENNYREIMLTMDEINSLLAEAKVIGETFYQTVLILMITGMRRGELFSLTWTEVNFEDHFIMLSKDKTKTKKRRHIPMSSTLEAVLESLPKDGERVMGGYTTHILEKQWKKLILRISSTV